MSLNQNQFSQIPQQGQMDLQRALRLLSCQVDSSQVTALVPGQAVTLVDSAGGVPKVVAAAADTDTIFGFVAYSLKKSSYSALDPVEISTGHDDVMYMTASAAVARGAKVMAVIASTKVATATVGKTVIGFAVDKAAADGDLIRVALMLPNGPAGAEEFVPASNVAALAGTLTGTVDGTIADVAAIALSTSNTYSDSAVNTAVNTAITSINLQLKELQTVLNAEIAALKAAGLQASS